VRGEWKTRPLGDVCRVIGGGTPSKGRPEFYGGTIPWATVGDMQVEMLSSTVSRITEDAVGKSATNVIPAGSVVIATRVGLGKVCMLGQDTAINQDLRGIIPLNRSQVSERYLFWWFKSIADCIVAEGTGATVQGVKVPFVKALSVPVPPPAEQQRIVGILDKAFAAMSTARENAEKNLRNARALFESHLESIFTQRGAGWMDKRLEEVGATQTGSTPKTADRDNYGNFIPFVKPADFNRDGSLDYKNHGLTEVGLSQARRVVAESVLMVCIGATIGKCGYCDRNIATNQQVNALTPHNSACYKFVYYQMLTEDFQRRVLLSSGQTTLPIISKSKWGGLTLATPSTVREQQLIAAELDALRAETQRLESIYQRKLAALDELKNSLLHQAFSGDL